MSMARDLLTLSRDPFLTDRVSATHGGRTYTANAGIEVLPVVDGTTMQINGEQVVARIMRGALGRIPQDTEVTVLTGEHTGRYRVASSPAVGTVGLEEQLTLVPKDAR